MNSKITWVWLLLAGALVGLAVLSQKTSRPPVLGPLRVLPEFKAAITTSVQVTPAGQLDIRAERTNAIWQLTKPIPYPAQGAGVDRFLNALEELNVAMRITGTELRQRPDAETEFGLKTPQFNIALQDRDKFLQLKIGAHTPSGDQVYLEIVGVDGLFVVDAGWLKLMPRNADDWRDRALVDLRGSGADRISVSNATAPFELQRGTTNSPWTVTRPVPGARVDHERLLVALQKLQSSRIAQFVSDDPRADLQSYGLQPPELQLTFSQGSNRIVRLEFGKTAGTNDTQVYARRGDRSGVVLVPKGLIEAWYEPFEKFRDHRVLGFARPVDQIEVRGPQAFTVLWQNGGWKIPGQDFPVDAQAVIEMVVTAARLPILRFRDNLTEQDFNNYGLTNGARQLVFRSSVTNAGVITNIVVGELMFGTVDGDVIHARRPDENSAYGVPLADTHRLPTAPFELRQRRIWEFGPEEVARLTIRQGDRSRELIHTGTNSWMFAANSQGAVNNFAIEEAVLRFGHLAATMWTEPAPKDLARYGIVTNGHSITLELTSGEKREIRFGGTSPFNYPYAVVMLDGQPWVFEFPLDFYHNLVLRNLIVPATP